MPKQNRGALQFTGMLACVSLLAFDALAQTYPVKPIRMVVGFAPGGGADTTARVVGQKLGEALGQQIIIENRPGASGSIGTQRVISSPADGYTLLMMASSSPVYSALHPNLSFDLERDLAPISLVTVNSLVLVVHPSVPARNVDELIKLARSQPGKLSYGSDGAGSTLHLAGELFKSMAGVKIVHVPYKGGAESSIATAAGQIDMSFPSVPAALPLLGAGKLRALAVTSAKRVSFMPSIPTVDESGLPGYDHSVWAGVLAKAGVAKEILTRLNALIAKVVNTAEMKESLNKQGTEPQTSTPEQFAAHIQREIAKNAKLIKFIGLKAE